MCYHISGELLHIRSMVQAADKPKGDTPSAMEVDSVPEVSKKLNSELVVSLLASNVALIEKNVKSKHAAASSRVLRITSAVRKKLTVDILQQFIVTHVPSSAPLAADMMTALKLEHGLASSQQQDSPSGSTTSGSPSQLPEVEAYACLLTLLFLTDSRDWVQMKQLATAALRKFQDINRRTLDVITARIYSYYSLSHEHTQNLPQIRSELLAMHRTAVLRHDELGQETLLNLLLRNYLLSNLYDQAEALRSKAQRPETSRSSTQLARYAYYHGRILAVQLDYTAASDLLQQALRKAPMTAYCFRAEVTKWWLLVRLLLSDIPERTELTSPGLSVALQPYFRLAAAVRSGDLAAFKQAAEDGQAVWARDRISNLVVRLRQNVLRTGLAHMGTAYSRITLMDVAEKLGVASVGDAESIVAKVIRDGGLEATVDHEAGVVICREKGDVYNTNQPSAAFHARTTFCLDVHNEAVRAMRFEEGANRRKGETDEERAERIKEEAELAKALAEEEPDDAF